MTIGWRFYALASFHKWIEQWLAMASLLAMTMLLRICDVDARNDESIAQNGVLFRIGN